MPDNGSSWWGGSVSFDEVVRQYTHWIQNQWVVEPWQEAVLRDLGQANAEAPKEERKEDPMAMSKQDYAVVAKVLADKRPDPKQGTIGERRVWALVVRGLADALEGNYPGFDRRLFYEACGYTGEGL